MKECGKVASDDTNAVGLDADADVIADAADETDADIAADVGRDADGWCGIEGDDQDGKYKEVVADPDFDPDPDPDLDPEGPCAEEDDDDCDGKYKEADEEEEHKGFRHFLDSPLVSSDFLA